MSTEPGAFQATPAATLAEPIAVAASTATPEAPAKTPRAPATCVACGVTVSAKVRDYCEQHSDRFGGRIYCFKHQRGVRVMPATD